VLIPEIEPVTAVVLDNLATHRNKEAEALLRVHGRGAPARPWLLVPVLAALQPGLEPDRNGLLQIKGAPAPHRSTILHRGLRRP
jgi:hypothetical protein